MVFPWQLTYLVKLEQLHFACSSGYFLLCHVPTRKGSPDEEQSEVR